MPHRSHHLLARAAGCALLAAAGCRPSGPPVVGAGTEGEAVYRSVCQTCHGASGQGVARAFPPLAGSAWATGDDGRAARIVLHGMTGEIARAGATYDGMMPGQDHLSDEKIAAVLTFVRANFGNAAPAVTPETVAAVRAAESARRTAWTAAELETATGTAAAR